MVALPRSWYNRNIDARPSQLAKEPNNLNYNQNNNLENKNESHENIRENAIKRMREEPNAPRLEPAEGEATISGAIITADKGQKSTIDVVTGSLCLFPSSLHHYTVPFEGKEDRIVLAFDVIPKIN